MVKLLGDSSLVPTGVGIAIIGPTSGTQSKKGSGVHSPTNEGNRFEGLNAITQTQQFKLLEGAERFLKTTEMIGKYLLDFKDFTH